MVIFVGNEYEETSSNPVCISYGFNTIGKALNPNIILPAIGKQ